MKKPDWYAEAIARQGQLALNGEKTRAEAVAALIRTAETHPEYAASLLAADADREVAHWLREHESSGDLFQAALFPMLPASMRTSPKKTAEVASMTGPDLDHAKNMLYARTQNQIEGAEKSAMAERAAFDAFYERVRPLLADDLTVGDVISRIATENAA